MTAIVIEPLEFLRWPMPAPPPLQFYPAPCLLSPWQQFNAMVVAHYSKLWEQPSDLFDITTWLPDDGLGEVRRIVQEFLDSPECPR